MNKKIYPLFIFLLSLLIGLSYAILFTQPVLSPDALEYDTLGWILTRGKGYQLEEGVADVTREPLYPFFLSIIYRIFGHNYLVVALIQAAISALTCVFIYIIGKQIFGEIAARLASLIAVIYPAFIVYSPYILTEVLFTFLLILSVYSLLKAIASEKVFWYILCGLCLGFSTLCKAISMFLPFLICLMSFLFERKRAKIKALWIVICFLLVVGPWAIRNYKVFHRIIPVRIGMGFNLWVGSYLPWEGKSLGGKGGYPEGRVKYVEAEPLKSLMKGHTDIEADEILRKEALKNISVNPLGYLRLSLKRSWLLWKDAIGKETLKQQNLFLSRVFGLAHYLFLLLSIYGIAAAFIKRNKLSIIPFSVLLYFTLIYSIGFASPRYHFPVLPFMIIFASSGICLIKEKLIR